MRTLQFIDAKRRMKIIFAFTHVSIAAGASLAHDRGRLEAKIETLMSELNLMRKNLEVSLVSDGRGARIHRSIPGRGRPILFASSPK
jgi:hypothetical protein